MSFLQFLLEIKSSQQKKVLLRSVTPCQVKVLSEIVTNLMRPEFPIPKNLDIKLRRYQKLLRILVDSKTPYKKKKAILENGSKWITLVLQATSPLLKWSIR